MQCGLRPLFDFDAVYIEKLAIRGGGMGNGHAVLENRDPKFALRVDIIGSDAPYGKPWSEPILKLYHEPGSKFSDPVQL